MRICSGGTGTIEEEGLVIKMRKVLSGVRTWRKGETVWVTKMARVRVFR